MLPPELALAGLAAFLVKRAFLLLKIATVIYAERSKFKISSSNNLCLHYPNSGQPAGTKMKRRDDKWRPSHISWAKKLSERRHSPPTTTSNGSCTRRASRRWVIMNFRKASIVSSSIATPTNLTSTRSEEH